MADIEGQADIRIGPVRLQVSNLGVGTEKTEIDEKDMEITFLKDRIKQLENELARLQHRKKK